MPPIIILAFAAVFAGSFPIETDPGGCRLERIAGVDGENHTLFRGVSPDGRQLAVGWDRNPGEVTERGAYLVDLVTGARQDLPGLNNAASFSPNGRRLVAANYPGDRALLTEIVELDLDSGKTRSLAPDSAMDWLPSYDPDGASVVFNSFRSGGSDLYRVRLSDGALTRLTDDPRYDAHAQVSADGRRILFHRNIKEADYGLTVLDVASGEVTELPGSAGEESYPAWSADGRWLSYGADAGQAAGATDVYVAPAAGGPARRLTAHPAKDAYSTWSPDGRHLYFMSQRDLGVRIYRIEMADGDCRR